MILCRQFLNWGLLLSEDPNLCQVEMTSWCTCFMIPVREHHLRTDSILLTRRHLARGLRVTTAIDVQWGKCQRVGFTESTLMTWDSYIHPYKQLHGLSTCYEQWDHEEMTHNLGATVVNRLSSVVSPTDFRVNQGRDRAAKEALSQFKIVGQVHAGEGPT